MSVGTPVIAFNGGGYKETVLSGKTGLLFDEYSVEGLISAVKKFNNLTIDPQDCIKQAQRFSKERFKKEIERFVKDKLHEKRD
jgi:glycosyltransferase involved in cell wall biosynthesis